MNNLKEILLAGVSASEALRSGLCNSLWGASSTRPDARLTPPPQNMDTYNNRGKEENNFFSYDIQP